MTQRSTSADFVTAFATGWPEHQPDILVLSLTTAKGIQDFALNKEQALLIAKTMKDTAVQQPAETRAENRVASTSATVKRCALNWLSALIITDRLLPRVVNEICIKPRCAGDDPKVPLAARPSEIPLTPRPSGPRSEAIAIRDDIARKIER